MRRREQPRDPGRPFAVQVKQTFPNVDVDIEPDRSRVLIDTVSAANGQIVQLRAPGVAVDLSGRQASACGLGRAVKIVWQLAGTARIDRAASTLELHKGDVAVMPLSASYRFEADQDHDALFLVFDTAARPDWRHLAEAWPATALQAGSAAAAARAGATSLLRHADGSRGDALAVEACLELMFHAFSDGRGCEPASVPPHHLRRAALLIEQNIGDALYDPAALARDLGRSRRALYKDFEELGTTPARFIRQMRLAAAQRAIVEGGPDSTLTEIALEHGFADGASFSHAFRKAFGTTPSCWRRRAG